MKISTKPDITRLSTYYFQSTAEVMITLQEESDLLEAFDYIQKEKLPYQILGKGSNVVLPPHYDGVILLDKISPLLATLKRTEWTGLPGTISGAVYGNAGIPGCEIGAFVQQVTIFDFDTGEFSTLSHDQLEFEYRNSIFKKEKKRNIFIADVILDQEKLSIPGSTTLDMIQERNKKQPKGLCCGSVFKNSILLQPPYSPVILNLFQDLLKKEAAPGSSIPAGLLIEQAGWKGHTHKGITISEKHANFWMHDGQHDSSGFRELVDMVKKDIKNKFGIELELEVEVV